MTFAEIAMLISIAFTAIVLGIREGILIRRWIRAQPIRLRPHIEVNNFYLLFWLIIVTFSVILYSATLGLLMLTLTLMLNSILIPFIAIVWAIVSLIQLRIEQ